MIRITGRILSGLAVLVLSQAVFASAVPTAHKAPAGPLVYDVTSLVETGNPQAPQAMLLKLVAGKEVRFSAPTLAGGRIVFEDLKPNANWAHDANYKRLDASGNVIETIPARFPPARMNRQIPLLAGTPRDVHLTSNADFKLNDFGGAMKVADNSHFYAVLLNGAGSERHWNDQSFLYRVLTKIYGYDPKHIFVADSNYISTNPDLDGDGVADIQYQSTIAGLTGLLQQMATTVTAKDQFLFAAGDHGDTGSTLVLEDGEMSAETLGGLLHNIPAARMVAIYEPCFSGGLVRPTVDNNANRVAVAAASNIEESWGTDDGMWDTFIYGMIAGFAKQLPDGTPVASDLNGDGKISVREALAYSIGADNSSESPFGEDYPDSGFAATIGLGF